MRQFNKDNPVNPTVNGLYAYFDSRNFMKLYEADFGKLEVLRRLTNRLEGELRFEWTNRIPVANSRINGKWGADKSFAPNEVNMPYVPATLTGRSISSTISGELDWYPTLTSSIYNEYQYFRASSSPKISLQWTHAIPGISGSKADYTTAGISIFNMFELSDKLDLQVFAKSSTFLRKVQFGQMDALQVLGNQLFWVGSRPIEQFRNLPYYELSSSQTTAELHLQLTRSELIFGWLAMKKKNWKEVLIANGLANPNQPSFWELGYGIDGLWRFIHTEVVYSQLGSQKAEWRFLVGTEFSINVRPKTYNRNP